MKDLMSELKKLGLLAVETDAVEKVPTGILLLDKVLSGGYPAGRIIELFGSEGSGKSYLSLVTAARFQREGRRVVLFDVEGSFDPIWASKVGVDVSNLLVLQADYGEQVFEGIRVLAESGVNLIIVDSTAALVPKSELEGSIEDQSIGLQARMISKALRTVNAVVTKNKCIVLFINQLREKMNTGFLFGDSTDSPGGRALKFYASVRIRVEKGSAIKEDKETVGHYIVLRIVKNKIGIPYKVLSLPFYYGKGIDEKQALLEHFIENRIILQSGRKYTLNDKSWLSFKEMYDSTTLEELASYL